MEMYTVVEGLALVAWGKFFYSRAFFWQGEKFYFGGIPIFLAESFFTYWNGCQNGQKESLQHPGIEPEAPALRDGCEPSWQAEDQ